MLRNVALSTNSVAASVEPVMQQQFFTLSPMAGQESFGSQLDARPSMAHTPTTSSMLAALQHDTFTVTLDTSSSAFNPDAFSSLSYMDPAGSQDDLTAHAAGLSFPDYVAGSGPFDVAAFAPHDLVLSSAPTPPSTSSEADSPEPVKSEP